MRSALIFNTAPMMSVSIKTRGNYAWSVVMQRFPILRPGQLSFSIQGLSCGQSAWTTTPTAQACQYPPTCIELACSQTVLVPQ
jgi:hypothetical protein